MQRRRDENATKMSTKGHEVLWPFLRHPELLRTPFSLGHWTHRKVLDRLIALVLFVG